MGGLKQIIEDCQKWVEIDAIALVALIFILCSSTSTVGFLHIKAEFLNNSGLITVKKAENFSYYNKLPPILSSPIKSEIYLSVFCTKFYKIYPK